MEINKLINLCKELQGTWEDRPFGPDNSVMKVGDKMFAIISEDKGLRINLKCDPDFALVLREQYSYIIPGYHMNKRHWNTVVINDDVDIELLKNLVKDSYSLVFNSLPKKVRQRIQGTQ